MLSSPRGPTGPAAVCWDPIASLGQGSLQWSSVWSEYLGLTYLKDNISRKQTNHKETSNKGYLEWSQMLVRRRRNGTKFEPTTLSIIPFAMTSCHLLSWRRSLKPWKPEQGRQVGEQESTLGHQREWCLVCLYGVWQKPENQNVDAPGEIWEVGSNVGSDAADIRSDVRWNDCQTKETRQIICFEFWVSDAGLFWRC